MYSFVLSAGVACGGELCAGCTHLPSGPWTGGICHDQFAAVSADLVRRTGIWLAEPVLAAWMACWTGAGRVLASVGDADAWVTAAGVGPLQFGGGPGGGGGCCVGGCCVGCAHMLVLKSEPPMY